MECLQWRRKCADLLLEISKPLDQHDGQDGSISRSNGSLRGAFIKDVHSNSISESAFVLDE